MEIHKVSESNYSPYSMRQKKSISKPRVQFPSAHKDDLFITHKNHKILFKMILIHYVFLFVLTIR